MRKFAIVLILCTALLLGCSSKPSVNIPLAPVTTEQLIDKPDPSLMQPVRPAERLPASPDNATAVQVLTSNNVRSVEIENKFTSLQQYVCNLFKDPVGTVCTK